jgi:hypothetical protein
MKTEVITERGFGADREEGAKTRKEAISLMSFSPAVVKKVTYGWIGFESVADYEVWKNQN